MREAQRAPDHGAAGKAQGIGQEPLHEIGLGQAGHVEPHPLGLGLLAQGRELAEHFAVSTVTVRSDLAALEAYGRLRRVRGGKMVQEAEDGLLITTFHGAKGLEFDNVFLAGWEEGLFPNQRAIDEGGTKALEEERRLAYVGMTRARRRLTISFAANRRVYNQWSSSVPSRFIDELPGAHIEHLHRNPATRPDLGTFLDDEPFVARPTSRFRSRRAEAGKLIEGRAEILQTRPVGKTGAFKVGDHIFHDKFGYGKVEVVDGNKLDISFEHTGRKKVIDSFVRPA